MLGFGQAIMGAGDPSPAVADVFAATIYTGNGTSQTITTGVNLTGGASGPLMQGGLVWVKQRNAVQYHGLADTLRGSSFPLYTNDTSGTALNTTLFPNPPGVNGFSVGGSAITNDSGGSYVAWSFRRAARFFSVATWTGDGSSNRAIAHGLGIAPGMVATKITSTAGDWNVYHRSATGDLAMNTTAAQTGSHAIVTAVSSTTFTVTGVANTNAATYVAYVFGHDTTTDGIVQCGTYTGNGSTTGPTVTLGWQPQFILAKCSSTTGNWTMLDAARGIAGAGAADAVLLSNVTTAEASSDRVTVSGTGFQVTSTNADVNTNAATYCYLTIRKP